MNSIKWGAFLTLLVGFLASLVLFLGFYKAAPPSDNTLGFSGPDVNYPQQCINGFCRYYYHVAMFRATSTPCVFLSPPATSTLRVFTANISSSTSVTATTYTLATSTTPNATTSIISYFGTTATTQRFGGASTTIASGAYGQLVYSGGASSTAESILPPSTYVALGVQGGTGNFGTAAQIGGTCNMALDFTQ